MSKATNEYEWWPSLARPWRINRFGDTKPRMNAGINQGNVSYTQADRLLAYLRIYGMARLAELRAEGITAATVSRLERKGAIARLSRGIYQLPDVALDQHHSLAEVAKRVPKGVICLVSALAFHGLTDQMPRRVQVAIGRKSWASRGEGTPLQVVRYADDRLVSDVEVHEVEGVAIQVFSVARSLADVFEPRRRVSREVALQALREAVRRRMATPAELAAQAQAAGVWRVMAPYLEALSLDG